MNPVIRSAVDVQVRTDFNELHQGNLLGTILPVDGTLLPKVGETVTLIDGEENSCLGVVEKIQQNGLILVRPVWATWAPATPLVSLTPRGVFEKPEERDEQIPDRTLEPVV